MIRTNVKKASSDNNGISRTDPFCNLWQQRAEHDRTELFKVTVCTGLPGIFDHGVCRNLCPCYNVGDVFEFFRDEERDDFWHCGLNTLIHTVADPDTVAGGPKMPFCSELWDAISRYIYTGLQGGSIMKGWMDRENEMIACCSDGTRPVIFKIERIDYE